MAITVNIETSIDVINKQRRLTEEALGPDGLYITLKENLQELLNDGSISGTDKATAISQSLVQMAGAVTTNIMDAAVKWAAQEKEIELRKTELEYQLENLRLQALLTDNQIKDSLATRQVKQAQLIREYGVPVKDVDGNITALGDNGKEYVTMQNIIQDTANKTKLNDQIDAQTDEVLARTHRTIADTYVNHGMFTGYTIAANGITGASKIPTSYVTLSDLQKQVAAQQAKGYSFNAWSNALTGSSGMIGTLIAAETTVDPTPYLTQWQTAISKLNNIAEPSISI